MMEPPFTVNGSPVPTREGREVHANGCVTTWIEEDHDPDPAYGIYTEWRERVGSRKTVCPQGVRGPDDDPVARRKDCEGIASALKETGGRQLNFMSRVATHDRLKKVFSNAPGYVDATVVFGEGLYDFAASAIPAMGPFNLAKDMAYGVPMNVVNGIKDNDVLYQSSEAGITIIKGVNEMTSLSSGVALSTGLKFAGALATYGVFFIKAAEAYLPVYFDQKGQTDMLRTLLPEGDLPEQINEVNKMYTNMMSAMGASWAATGCSDFN